MKVGSDNMEENVTQKVNKNKVLQKNNQEENNVVRDSLTQALVQLLKHKKLADISITELAKKAGVSRNAYYRNYKSKDDLLNYYLKEIIEKTSKVLNLFDPITQTKESWLALLSMIEKNHFQYEILLKAGYEATILNQAEIILDQKQPSKIYMNHFWLGGLFAVINEWVRLDLKTPKYELAEQGSKMMLQGINSWK